MLGLAENEDADGQHNDRPDTAKQKNLEGGILLPKDDIAHERHESVHGIHLDDTDSPCRGTAIEKHLEVPEHRRQIIPSGKDNAPQVDDIAEKDRGGGKHEADTDAEDHKEAQADRKPNEVPRGHHAEPQHNDRNRNE